MSTPELPSPTSEAKVLPERPPPPADGGLRRERPPVRSLTPSEAVAEAELGGAPEDRPQPPGSRWREWVATSLAIGAGGVLGAICRYRVGVWAAARWGTAFPWGTLLINVSGSFVLGFYLTLVTERFSGRPTTRLLVATGFLGAYTTFSTFGHETVTLLQHGRIFAAAAYVVGSLLFGLVAVIAGTFAAHAL